MDLIICPTFSSSKVSYK